MKCVAYIIFISVFTTVNNCTFSGGSFSGKSVKECEPKIVTNGIVSVRKFTNGRGASLRVFVNTNDMVCYSETCSIKYSTLPANERKTAWCNHLKEGVNAIHHAVRNEIPVEKVFDLNLSQDIVDLVNLRAEDGFITTYIINKSTIVTPSFGIGHEFDLTHVKDCQCRIKDCKVINTPHALAKRTDKICIHSLLVLLGGFKSSEKSQCIIRNKMDHLKTTNRLIQLVKENFPTIKDESLNEFLPRNTAFLERIRWEHDLS